MEVIKLSQAEFPFLANKHPGDSLTAKLSAIMGFQESVNGEIFHNIHIEGLVEEEAPIDVLKKLLNGLPKSEGAW